MNDIFNLSYAIKNRLWKLELNCFKLQANMRYYEGGKGMETKIIFIGNYKGGVGKTTSVLNFAEYFSKENNKSNTGKNRVLVLDIDPQSSLSEILVSKGGYGALSDLPAAETLNYVFDLYISKIDKYHSIELKFDNAMIKSYKKIYDFVPSSLFYQENMGLDMLALKMKDDIQYLSILKNWIDTIKDNYDIILIDCPPANNLITRSAFLMSDYYVIPTILDGLSTNGVVHYISTIEDTYNEYCEKGADALITKHFFGEKPQLIGVFYNLLRGQVNYNEAKRDFEDAIENLTPYKRNIILNCEINNYIDIARRTQEGNVSIDKRDFEILAKEIIDRI